jgi:multidrug efflux system outer membrane protein
VLTAFKEVEDALAQVTLFNKQVAAQAEALASARRVTELVRVRYEAGAVTYLDVVDAEERQLEQESTKTQIEGQRFAATVRLIKALGGGWD